MAIRSCLHCKHLSHHPSAHPCCSTGLPLIYSTLTSNPTDHHPWFEQTSKSTWLLSGRLLHDGFRIQKVPLPLGASCPRINSHLTFVTCTPPADRNTHTIRRTLGATFHTVSLAQATSVWLETRPIPPVVDTSSSHAVRFLPSPPPTLKYHAFTQQCNQLLHKSISSCFFISKVQTKL